MSVLPPHGSLIGRSLAFFVLGWFSFGIPILNYYFNTFSYGFFIFACLLFLLFDLKLTKRNVLLGAFVVVILLIQVSFVNSLNYKSSISSIVIVWCFGIYYIFGKQYLIQKINLSLKPIKISALLVFCCAIISYTISKYAMFSFYEGYAKPCFPFSEPSHLAIFYSPLIFFIFPYCETKEKYFFIFTLFFSAIYLQSLVFCLFALILSILFYMERGVFDSLLKISCIAVFIFVIDLSFLDSYMFDRIYQLYKPRYNISSFVYLQGWENVRLTITQWQQGIGFQSLGSEPPNYYSYLIRDINGDFVNRMDGAFLFAKYFTELGFAGLLVFLVSVPSLMKSIMKNKNLLGNLNKSLIYLSVSLIVPLFVRDVGYFSYSTVYIFLVLGLASSLGNKINGHD